MQITMMINGQRITDDIKPDMLLLDFLRAHGCYSVKRGCETSKFGLCTVWLDGKPILPCCMFAVRCDGHSVTTLEGVAQEAHEFADYKANQGHVQCGFCSPVRLRAGFVVW